MMADLPMDDITVDTPKQSVEGLAIKSKLPSFNYTPSNSDIKLKHVEVGIMIAGSSPQHVSQDLMSANQQLVPKTVKANHDESFKDAVDKINKQHGKVIISFPLNTPYETVSLNYNVIIVKWLASYVGR